MDLTFPAVALLPTLQALSACSAGLAFYRLLKAGLHRTYRQFFLFLVFYVIATAISMFLRPTSNSYFYFFLGTLPVMWYFYLRCAIEIYRYIFRRHKGFYSVARWTVYAGLGASVTISAYLIFSRLTPELQQASKLLFFVEAANRGIDSGIAVCLLLMMALLGFYAVPLSRNVRVHAVVFCLFFISSTLGTILRSVFGLRYGPEVEAGLLAVATLCGFAWFLFLTPGGETVQAPATWFGAEHEERILEKLDALNAALLKASGK